MLLALISSWASLMPLRWAAPNIAPGRSATAPRQCARLVRSKRWRPANPIDASVPRRSSFRCWCTRRKRGAAGAASDATASAQPDAMSVRTRPAANGAARTCAPSPPRLYAIVTRLTRAVVVSVGVEVSGSGCVSGLSPLPSVALCGTPMRGNTRQATLIGPGAAETQRPKIDRLPAVDHDVRTLRHGRRRTGDRPRGDGQVLARRTPLSENRPVRRCGRCIDVLWTATSTAPAGRPLVGTGCGWR